MKSAGDESPKELPTAPESAEIFDFLYVDRARISALYAQLFPQGIITSVKTISQQSFSDDSNIGSDVKIFKAEAKSSKSGSEGIEHFFDASWSIPLEVLSRLRSLERLHDSIRDAGLGSLVVADCHLRIIDFASMQNIWEPALRLFMASGTPGSPQAIIPETVTNILDALKAAPQAIHAHFITAESFLWSSLQASNLTIPVTDITLKYGGSVSGQWKLLYILDTWPDSGEPPDVSNWSAGDLINGVLGAMHGLKLLMGKPSSWIGITPLMIYRSTSGRISTKYPAE
jgi:hypothetical protein